MSQFFTSGGQSIRTSAENKLERQKKLSKRVPQELTAYQKNHRNPLPLQQKRIKYLGINLPKETKELCTENFKTLMKEIKDDINR